MRSFDLSLGIDSLAKGILLATMVMPNQQASLAARWAPAASSHGSRQHANRQRHGGLDMSQRPSVWRGCSNQANDLGTYSLPQPCLLLTFSFTTLITLPSARFQ